MAILNNDTTLNAEITLTKQNGTKVTFATDRKYVPKDIQMILNVQGATPAFSGGDLSNTNATAEFVNAIVSTTNSSHVSIVPQAQSTINAVYYDGAVNGWVTQSDEDIIIESSENEWSGSTYYLNGVSLPANSTFTVITPNGGDSLVGSAIVGTSHIGTVSTYQFSVDANGITTLTGGSTSEYTDADEVSY